LKLVINLKTEKALGLAYLPRFSPAPTRLSNREAICCGAGSAGIDAVAVLRIANLPAPQTDVGPHPVEHRGDATLINLMARFDGGDPDEHALALRKLVGPALDAHDDPRGILLFRDVKYPRATTYGAIVSELSVSGSGVWAPKVEADYIPVRFKGRPRQPHDALVGELIAASSRSPWPNVPGKYVRAI
jgi:hypothetical protein